MFTCGRVFLRFFCPKGIRHDFGRFKSTLVVVEHGDNIVTPSSRNVITAAQQIGDITCLVAGYQCSKVAEEVSQITGVKKVLLAEHEILKDSLPEIITKLLVSLQKQHNFTHIASSADSFGKSLMPRLAAVLDVAPISDITAIKSEDTFVRTIYAGNAVQTLKVKDPVKVMTVRGTSFDPSSLEGSADIEKVGRGPKPLTCPLSNSKAMMKINERFNQ